MMKKYLIALLVLFIFVFPVFANEEEYEDVELNAFGYPDKNFVAIIEAKHSASGVKVLEKPDCGDKALAEAVQKNAKPYINKGGSTIYDKRRNFLITKNIDNFSDLSIDEAQNMKDKILKARLVELKINNRIGNENIKLCQSNNPILNDKLFILMYDNNNNVMIELLNLKKVKVPEFYFYDK